MADLIAAAVEFLLPKSSAKPLSRMAVACSADTVSAIEIGVLASVFSDECFAMCGLQDERECAVGLQQRGLGRIKLEWGV